MDRNQDLRHNFQPPINELGVHENVHYKRIHLIALFFVQFLLSQLVLSYGMYAIHFIDKYNSIIETILPPFVLLATPKILNPWFRDVSESFHEEYFRTLYVIGAFICATGVSLCYFFSDHIIACTIFYGFCGGIGSTLVLHLIKYQLDDMFPYQNQLVHGIQHIGMAFGLFLTPHLLKVIFDSYGSSAIYLIHGAILLHIIPAGLLLGKRKITPAYHLTPYYNNVELNDPYEEEMIDMSNKDNLSYLNRSWKSPSDHQIDYDDEIDLDEIEDQEPIKHSSVNVLPIIEEEDEEISDDETETNKNNGVILNDNLKRMSVISTKFEELILKNDNDDEIILDIKNLQSLSEPTKNEIINTNITVEPNNNVNIITKNTSCNTNKKYRYRRRLKWCFSSIFNITLRPAFRSFRIMEFYPCLFTNIHSMLSPLIFLCFVAFKAHYIVQERNHTELSIIYSITAFAYLVFLITLPWITEISKKKLKYIYIIGCLFSAVGVWMCIKTKSDEFLVVSCLIYGFGLGIESYLKDIIIKETLGVIKWAKTESSLEVLSGILYLIFVFILRGIIPYENESKLLYIELWLDVIGSSHFIICILWILYPLISYLINVVCFKRNYRLT